MRGVRSRGDAQVVVIAKSIVNILCPSWFIGAAEAVDAFSRFEPCLPIGTSKVIPVVLEWRISIIATLKFVPGPDFNLMFTSNVLSAIWVEISQFVNSGTTSRQCC